MFYVSDRRLLTWVAAFALLTIGLLALQFPVFLDDFDRWGIQIKCGSGFSAAPIQASIADEFNTQHPDMATSTASYTQLCKHALTVRRIWAIVTAAVGGAILAYLVVLLLKPQRQQDNTINSPD